MENEKRISFIYWSIGKEVIPADIPGGVYFCPYIPLDISIYSYETFSCINTMFATRKDSIYTTITSLGYLTKKTIKEIDPDVEILMTVRWRHYDN